MAKGRGEELPDGATGLSDYEIAKVMGITRSRVFQIRERAMKRLRDAILRDPELRDLVEDILDTELITG